MIKTHSKKKKKLKPITYIVSMLLSVYNMPRQAIIDTDFDMDLKQWQVPSGIGPYLPLSRKPRTS